MKLNRNQPFGVVVGHEWARYEQNGVLFDAQGYATQATGVIDKASKKSKREVLTLKHNSESLDDLKVRNAKEFLKTLMAGGPMDKSIVYREAENNNQDWSSVKTAFSQMNGQEFSRGTTTVWRVLPEFMEGR